MYEFLANGSMAFVVPSTIKRGRNSLIPDVLECGFSGGFGSMNNRVKYLFNRYFIEQYGYDFSMVGCAETCECFDVLNDIKGFSDNSFLSLVIRLYREFIDKYNNPHYLVLRHKVDKGLCFVPMVHRFTKEYMNKVRCVMVELTKRYKGSRCVMLTLTLSPELYGYNKIAMWMAVKSEFDNFMTKLKRAYNIEQRKRVKCGLQSKVNPFPKYLSTVQAQIESGSKGNPHIHVVFVNASRLMDWRKVSELWGKGHIWINKTSPDDVGYQKKVSNPILYITRYICRTFTKINKNDDVLLLNQSLVWLFGVRAYSSSRGLCRCLNDVSSLSHPSDFEVLGILIDYVGTSRYDIECAVRDFINLIERERKNT